MALIGGGAPKEKDLYKTVANRVNTRCMVTLGDNKAKSLSRLHAKSATKGSRRGKGNTHLAHLSDMLPMDDLLLGELLARMKEGFHPPKRAVLPENIAETYPRLISKDQVQEFVSSQDAFMAKVASQENSLAGSSLPDASPR
jgi:hypothetical protein